MTTKSMPPRPTESAIRVYLGGSFDPVHSAHIQMALYVYQTLLPIARAHKRALHVYLLPNVRSPFKAHTIDPKHRLAMLQLAIKDTPLGISELELWQTPPVYTIDSVRLLSQRYPTDSLIFIMGMDSARSLARWKQGLELTDYVGLWLFERKDIDADATDMTPVTKALETDVKTADTESQANIKYNIKYNAKHHAKYPANRNGQYATLPIALQAQVTDSYLDLVAWSGDSQQPPPLKSTTQGRIYIDSRQISVISSSIIRQQLADSRLGDQLESHLTSRPILRHYLDPLVYQYIIAHKLYSVA